MTKPIASLQVKLFANRLAISIGIDTLAFAFEHGPIAQPFDAKRNAFRQALRVRDPRSFARAVCRALDTESEDGTTPVHVLLDAAMEKAAEDCDGVDEVDQWEPADYRSQEPRR